ncbi:MAG TPA: hypothetical protein VF992_05925 [Thermoplasmata archaeon]
MIPRRIVARLQRTIVAVGGIALTFALLVRPVPTGFYMVPYLVAVYAIVAGVVMPAALYAILVGPLSWSAIKQRWHTMRRPSFRW